MTLKLGLLAIACAAPLLSQAAWWESKWRGLVYYNSGTQIKTDGRHGPWRDRLWQGVTYHCDRNSPGNCTFTFGESVSTTFQKSIGGDMKAGPIKDVFNVGVNGSLTWSRTETKTWSAARPVKPRTFVRPVIYVDRRWSWGHYFGIAKFTGKTRSGGCNIAGCASNRFEYEWFWERDGGWASHVAVTDYSIASYITWAER